MKRKYNNRVDANQAKLVEIWRSLGAVVIPTTGDPDIGFDCIVCFRGQKELVEVKDGSKPPSKRKLTEGEVWRKTELETVGCTLRVIETEQEAIDLLVSMT